MKPITLRTVLGSHGPVTSTVKYSGHTYLLPWLHLSLGRHDLVSVLAGQPIRLLSRVLDATGSSSGSSG